MNTDDLNPVACLVAMLDQTSAEVCSVCTNKVLAVNCFVDYVECYEVRIPSERGMYLLTCQRGIL